MKLIEYFVQAYHKYENDERIKAESSTFEHFKIACKYLCGGATYIALKRAGVSNRETKSGVESKIVRYEPCMGITRREGGYVLSAKGMKEVYKAFATERIRKALADLGINGEPEIRPTDSHQDRWRVTVEGECIGVYDLRKNAFVD